MNQQRISPVAAIILLGLGGCTVGPDYRESVLTVPDHWQAGQGQSGNPAALKPIAPEALKNWWKSFGDARLDRLIDRALADNLDLKITMARIEQARAERRATRAELFPKVDAAVGAQRNDNPLPGLARGIRYNLFELGFDALWEIDLFGRQQRRLEAASADLDAANEQYRLALVTLTADLARSYIEYRSFQNQLLITRANLEAQQHTQQLTERLFSEGVGTRHDAVRARAQTENTMAQIPALQAGQITALRQLEVLVGRQPGSLAADLDQPCPVPTAIKLTHNHDCGGDFSRPVDNRPATQWATEVAPTATVILPHPLNLMTVSLVPAAPGWEILASPADTIRHRPDIRIAERRLAAATALQGAAIAELFPKVSLSAFLGLRNTDIEGLFKSAAFSYSTAANLMQPLLNFGRISAGIDLAKAQQQEAYLEFEKAVLEALRETETALTRYLNEETRRQTLAHAVADQRESVRLSQLRYQEGVISFLDVLDSQRALYIAEIELARSEADASTDLIAVYKALGGGANAKPPEISEGRQ